MRELGKISIISPFNLKLPRLKSPRSLTSIKSIPKPSNLIEEDYELPSLTSYILDGFLHIR